MTQYINSKTPSPGEIFVSTLPPYGHTGFVVGPNAVVDSNWRLDGVVRQHALSDIPSIAGYINMGGVLGSLGNLAGAALNFLSGIPQAALDGLKNLMTGAMNGIPKPWKDIGLNIGNQLFNAIPALQSLLGASGPSTPAGGNLGAWIAQAIALTGVPSSWAGPLSVLIGRESGGRADAVNLWDSNAKAGHPSQGLMQLIPGTFAAYHMPGTSGSITDPVANIAAGIRYILARYGDISRVQQANPALPPKGYDSGGWLLPGTTAYNGTGQPERVLSPAQDQDLSRVLQALYERLERDDNRLARIEQVLVSNGQLLASSDRHLASIDGAPVINAAAAARRAA
jgi:SLT domain-containing protein